MLKYIKSVYEDGIKPSFILKAVEKIDGVLGTRESNIVG
jgi:hypothetical protein